MARAYVARTMMKRALLALMLTGCGRAITTTDIPKPDPTPIQQQQPLKGCEGRALAMLTDRTLTRLTTTGTTTLFTFGDGFPAEEVSVSHWYLEGGVIGAVAFIHEGTQNAWTYEYVLLRTDGTVLFHRRQVEPYSPQIFLGPDGSMAVAGGHGWIARPDGTVLELGELMPMTPVLPDGSVIVARGKPWEPGTPKGVWKDGVFTPLQVQLAEYAALQVVGTRVVTVDGTSLVSLLDGVRIALPAMDLGLVQHAGGRFVLLASTMEAVQVDLDLGTARLVTNLPALHTQYSSWNASLQADGSVLASSTRGDGLQLVRSGDLGRTWADVGEPMMLGEDLGFLPWLYPLERGGSMLVHSMSTGYGHYLNEVQLVSPRGTHRLDAKGLYVNTDVNPGATDLSADGQCAAVWVRLEGLFDPAQLMLFDAEGKEQVLEIARHGWLRFVP